MTTTQKIGFQHTHMFAWLLYGDLNTRFNLLIDECQHLEDTVDSLLCCDSTYPGKEKSYNNYYKYASHERALINLKDVLGNIKLAINSNKVNFREHYKAFINKNSAGRNQVSFNGNLFWFIELRAHYIYNVLTTYLEQIEHAHQKLVQFLENLPGALPGPTLMRRWSNGAYGKFLSEYSRTVNYECQRLIYDLIGAPDEQFEGWRMDRRFVHTWTHDVTSMTRVIRTTNDSRETLKTTSIWSAYFYIDQPVLFPLLYHECAHSYSTRSAFPEDPDNISFNIWFEGKDQLAEELAYFKSNKISEGFTNSFWLQYLGEIWADVIGVAQGGKSYLFALILQLTGQNNNSEIPAKFFDYDEYGEQISLNEIGLRECRDKQIPFPYPENSYLWETRVRLAIRTYEMLYGDQDSICKAFEHFIESWIESGSYLYDESRSTKDHQFFWGKRVEYNHWAEKIIWNSLKSLAHQISVIKNQNNYQAGFSLCQQGSKIINDALQKFCESHFQLDHYHNHLNVNRLEDVSPAIRWELSKLVVAKLDFSDPDINNKWIDDFADFCRHDSSLGFRLAYEWIMAQKDFVLTIAKICDEKLNSTTKTKLNLGATYDNIRNVIDNKLIDIDTREVNNLLLHQKWDNSDICKNPNLKDIFNRYKNSLASALDCQADISTKAGVFTFGVIRPYSMPIDYCASHNLYAEFLQNDHQQRIGKVEKVVCFKNKPEIHIYAAMGEYSFASYEEYFTPTELNWTSSECKKSDAKVLSKPRFVIKLLNADLADKESIVKISQLAFKHKWQWVDLYEKIRTHDLYSTNVDMYLSSAWEDVILISHHNSMEDVLSFQNEFKLEYNLWQDVHSNFAKRISLNPDLKIPKPSTQSNEFMPLQKIHDLFKDLGATVSNRTGRFDLTVDWNTGDLNTLLKYFEQIPIPLLKQISNIVTSASYGNSVADEKFTFSSQIILNQDLY